MKMTARIFTAIVFVYCALNNLAQAAIIQSLTIEGIPEALSGQPGRNGGRVQSFFLDGTGAYGGTISSIGSPDSAINMGTVQGDNSFSVFIADHDPTLTAISTSNGSPSGSIDGGMLTLNLAGFVAKVVDAPYSITPTNNSLVTTATIIDSNHYYYTASWLTSISGDPFTWRVYLEGVATTTVPVPIPASYIMMLTALGVIGLVAKRRSKSR